LNLFHRIVTGPKKKSKKAKPPQTLLPRYLCELVLRGVGIEEVQDVLKTKIPRKGTGGGEDAEGGGDEEEEEGGGGKPVVFPSEENPDELRRFLEVILKDEEALNIMIEKRNEILEKAEPLSEEASTLFLFPEEEKYVYEAVENIVGDFPPFDLSDSFANGFVDLMVFGQEEPIKTIFPSYERTEQLCRWIVGRRGMEKRHKESLLADQQDTVPSWEEHDDFLEHDAEQTFARRSPPAVLIIGKRYCGKSTLGKFVAQYLNVPYISAIDLIKEDAHCMKQLRHGGASSWKDVANLMHKRLSSRYILSHGYVFDDLPCIVDGVNIVSKSDLRSFVAKSGLEDVFPPNTIIELGISDQESTYRVQSLRVDPKTGKIYSMYQLAFEPPKKSKKEKTSENEDAGEEDNVGEGEEEAEEEEEPEEWEGMQESSSHHHRHSPLLNVFHSA
jgi:adenylate kinase family enzyme